MALLLLAGGAMAVFDIRHQRLPNLGNFAFAAAVLLGLAVDGKPLVDGLVSASTLGAMALILYLFSNGTLGAGDVKFAIPLGLSLATAKLAVLVIPLAAALASIVAVIGLGLHRLTLASRLPFGPYLLAATLLLSVGNFGDAALAYCW